MVLTERLRFKLDDRFYQELHERLGRSQTEERNAILALPGRGFGPSWFQKIRLRALVPEAIPSVATLRDLVETAFWTSLLREEGRELRFTIKYIREVSNDAILKSPIDFTVSKLRKLAPALGEVEAGVYLSDDGRLKIAEISSLITESLAIKVLDPGLVIVSFSLWNVAAVCGDEPLFIGNSLLSWSNDIWSIFAPNGENFFAFSDPRVGTIINIAREMRRKGHGGTLLIVPPNADIKESISEIRYEVNEDNKVAAQPLRDLMEARRQLEANKEDKIAKDSERVWDRQLRSSVPQFIAQMTLVDGATLLSSDFDILGFGVRLKSSSNVTPSSVVTINPLENEAEVETAFNDFPWGTRHKSAAQFVFDNPGTVAIVVSQDGNVTAFVWRVRLGSDTACLHAFERLELTLF